MIKRKNSQQETVGFVLIIIIVAVIGLVFLWFLLRAPAKDNQTSVEISNLLEASMHYTSDCFVDYVPNYKNGEDLVKECYRSSYEKCSDGRTFCKALEDNFKGITSGSLNVGEESPIKAYKLKIYYNSTNLPEEIILKFDEGNFANCSLKYGGTSSILSGSGIIETKLEVCKRI